MYDRYKSKRRNTGPYKLLAVLIILGAGIFLVVRYHDYLAFWKYNRNKLYKTVDTARHIKDPLKKRESLADLAETFERYKEEHQVSPDAYFISGEVHYLLGVTYLPGNFSEMYINDRMQEIGPDARRAFLKAIKDLKKGSALEDGTLDDSLRLHDRKGGTLLRVLHPGRDIRNDRENRRNRQGKRRGKHPVLFHNKYHEQA